MNGAAQAALRERAAAVNQEKVSSGFIVGLPGEKPADPKRNRFIMTEHRVIEVIAAEKLTPSPRRLVDFYQNVAAPADSLATVPV